MKKKVRVNEIRLIAGLLLTGLLCVANAVKAPENIEAAPLVLQALDYTENPVDIPNPDRGAYRGRWQNISPNSVNETNSPFGITPEVDHRVPVDANSVLYQGRQVPPVEGDDIEETQFYNGVNQNANPYIGGTGVSALPSISFMCFDLCNFSSNAFLSAKDAFSYKEDGLFADPGTGATRTGKTQPLTTFALDYIRGLLQKVRDGNGVAFVKFSYDGNGFNYIEPSKYPRLKLTEGLIHGPEPTFITDNNPSAMCNVPGHEEKNWVQYHLWQLGNVFSEFEDCIMAVKGGVFGPWGEMHSSSYARTREGYHWLLKALLGYVPASRSILVHAGGVMAWYNMEYGTDYSFAKLMPAPARGTPAQRFGMFNDSYSAGSGGEVPNDNGSLSEGYSLIGTGDLGDFDRNLALTWIRNQNNFYGGETVGPGSDDNIYPRFPNVLYEAAYAQTTHLNTDYNQRTYKLWGDFVYNKENVTKPFTPPHDGVTRTAIFDPVYDGRNGMEYMRDRLGYRLVLREANASEWVEQNSTLRFEGKIQNVGFGNVVNKKNVSIILKTKNGSATYTAITNIDARDWRPDLDSRADNAAAWRDLNFSINMGAFGKVPPGDYDIFLKINDPKETSTNKRCIQFANHNIWNTTLGANLIGSTTVVP